MVLASRPLSRRALALLSVAVLPFVASAFLWLQHPTDIVARYAVVPSALVLVLGTIGYSLTSSGAPGALPSRQRLRR